MFKSYRFRIYPTKAQGIQLESYFQSTRTLYNCLVEREEDDKSFSSESGRLLIKELSYAQPQIKNIHPSSLNHVLINFNRTRQRSMTLNRKLRFKSAHGRESFSLNNVHQSIQASPNSVSASPFGKLKARISVDIAGRILRATIIKTGSQRYYMSLLTAQPDNPVTPLNQKDKLLCIGLDMGITHLLTRSDGQRVDNPRYFQESLKHLRHLQKDLARKTRGSANYRKQQIRIARFHERIVTRRNAFLHKASATIVRENDIIVVEKLGITDLLGEKKLSLRISDASWRKFIEMLTYKSQWYGKRLIQIDRYCPTTKICCKCRHRAEQLPLHIREWQCPQCATFHDRDTNAAINIMIEGVKTYIKENPTSHQKLIPVLSDRR